MASKRSGHERDVLTGGGREADAVTRVQVDGLDGFGMLWKQSLGERIPDHGMIEDVDATGAVDMRNIEHGRQKLFAQLRE